MYLISNQLFSISQANAKLRADMAKLHADMSSNSNQKNKLDKHFADLRGKSLILFS